MSRSLFRSAAPCAARRTFVAASLFVVLCTIARAEPDTAGCSDTNFSRMPGFYINDCERTDFDRFVFAEGSDHETAVEGRKARIAYALSDGHKAPSALAVIRNYQAIMQQSGWEIVENRHDAGLTARRVQGGKEQWVELDTNGGANYQIIYVDKGELSQQVTTADAMASALDAAGHVALQINFDTAKSTIRPESQAIVAQIAALLKSHPDLKLRVEGHTDNTGDAKSNQALSVARAKSVVAALVLSGAAPARLTAAGFGQDKPVADNTSEDGRARNRRVELVKL
jgi:outer membrane protein OmpA-like peptidoglycan-associated protein